MLAIIRGDTWNVLNMQHVTLNSKRWDYSDIPGGGHKNIKGPTHMAEGGHHLRKPPTTTQCTYWVLSRFCIASGISLLQTVTDNPPLRRKNLNIPRDNYDGCWSPGDARHLFNSKHGIFIFVQNILDLWARFELSFEVIFFESLVWMNQCY